VSQYIYVNTKPEFKELEFVNEKGETVKNTFWSMLCGISRNAQESTPKADFLNWEIKPWETITLDAETAIILGYEAQDGVDEHILPKHEAIDAFFTLAQANNLKLAISCESVQHGEVKTRESKKTGLPQSSLRIWPSEGFSIELFERPKTVAVSNATKARLQKLSATPAPDAQDDKPF